MQMFTSTRDRHQGKRYCADCADTNKEVRAELAAAYSAGSLDITDDSQVIAGQMCEACQRPIVSVPANLGVYCLEVTITFPVTVKLEARSATAAEFQLDKVIKEADFDDFGEDIDGVAEAIEAVIDAELDGPEEVTVGDYQYLVEPGRRVPPQQNVFATPTQERMKFL